jgi:hypothetical protein
LATRGNSNLYDQLLHKKFVFWHEPIESKMGETVETMTCMNNEIALMFATENYRNGGGTAQVHKIGGFGVAIVVEYHTQRKD